MTMLTLDVPEEIGSANRLMPIERAGIVLVCAAVLIFIVGAGGMFDGHPGLHMLLTLGIGTIGGLMAVLPGFADGPAGIRNNGIMRSSAKRRGAIAWALGVLFTVFYVLLYWYPSTLSHVVVAADPLSVLLRGRAADHWFFYGTLYTLAIVVMGIRMLAKYRHSRYHVIRTLSVMAAQLVAAYLIPAMLIRMESKEFYFSYFWPLKYEYLFPDTIDGLLGSSDGLLMFMGFWSLVMTFIATPILTWFYGKRWYCSWICGCGGLAETAGDPFRHNSDKSLSAWKVERWMVHGVLLFIVVTTIVVWLNSVLGGAILGSWSSGISRAYGFYIGALFSGVIGVGFYPILGSRVWCRFGCPMAAVLGILQRFASRFRITTNGGQCISCGNCSTYCEMGIDVRSYAQRGEDIRRASCVGCGVCATVCPRGVLKLENR